MSTKRSHILKQTCSFQLQVSLPTRINVVFFQKLQVAGLFKVLLVIVEKLICLTEDRICWTDLLIICLSVLPRWVYIIEINIFFISSKEVSTWRIIMCHSVTDSVALQISVGSKFCPTYNFKIMKFLYLCSILWHS